MEVVGIRKVDGTSKDCEGVFGVTLPRISNLRLRNAHGAPLVKLLMAASPSDRYDIPATIDIQTKHTLLFRSFRSDVAADWTLHLI
jgi:hypothetical protein